MNSKNFMNDIFGFNTIQAKYLSKKSALIFASDMKVINSNGSF